MFFIIILFLTPATIDAVITRHKLSSVNIDINSFLDAFGYSTTNRPFELECARFSANANSAMYCYSQDNDCVHGSYTPSEVIGDNGGWRCRADGKYDRKFDVL